MQKKKRSMSLCALLILLAMLPRLLSGCTLKKNNEPKTCEFFGYFDTVSSLKLYESDEDKLNEARNKFESLLCDYDRLLDIYESHGEVVNLYDINLNAGKEPLAVDERLFDALEFGKQMYSLTDGACNIALGSVISLWHEAREHASKDPDGAYIPSESDISEALLHKDINSLLLDRDTLSVQITDPGLSLDLGAVAKGFVAEKAADLLCSLGYESFLINLGGNVLAVGKKSGGESWSAMIEDPFDDGRKGYTKVLKLCDQTLVTSGSYQRFYTVGERKYSHIISNLDGMPPEHFVSVSVLAPSASSALADALSTALFCMQLDAGKKLIASLDGVEAIWIAADGSVICSNE